MAEKCSDKDLFKETFKKYKRKQPSPDLSDVIDFSLHSDKILLLDYPVPEGFKSPRVQYVLKELALSDPTTWKVYGLKEHPGFILLQNPFVPGGQHQWVGRCVLDYQQPPHISNVTNLLPQHLRNVELGSSGLTNDLRWVTLGYHFDWDTKMYSKEKQSAMPKELADLASIILARIGYDSFKAEAVIINYYQKNSTLSGHTDHSELDLQAPLVSISFGCSAVFLLGGRSKADQATAMLVRSGDIVILSGESRLAYHGVPKILTKVDDKHAVDCLLSSEYCSPEMSEIDPPKHSKICSFMEDSRINISIRKVFSTCKSC